MNAAIVELQAVSASDHDRNRQSQDHSVVVVNVNRSNTSLRPSSGRSLCTCRSRFGGNMHAPYEP